MMSANLGPVFGQSVAELVASGLYQSQSEVVREGCVCSKRART